MKGSTKTLRGHLVVRQVGRTLQICADGPIEACRLKRTGAIRVVVGSEIFEVTQGVMRVGAVDRLAENAFVATERARGRRASSVLGH